MLTAQEFVWEAAGKPVVRGPDGEPIDKADRGMCAYCGAPAVHRLKDCLSSNFVVAKSLRLGAAGLCEACAFCLRDLRLRCAPWFATKDGVQFCTDRKAVLAFLLDPPVPPFVAGFPRYGMDHGGMQNFAFARVWHPEREEQQLCPAKYDEHGKLVRAPQILGKLQSKHTAIFAQLASSRDRYPLQVDDVLSVMVDVVLWRRLAAQITEALRYIPGPCLAEWRAPSGGEQWRHGILHWHDLTAPFEPYRQAAWWSLLLDLVSIPERPVVEKAKPVKESATPKQPRPARQEKPQLALF